MEKHKGKALSTLIDALQKFFISLTTVFLFHDSLSVLGR